MKRLGKIILFGVIGVGISIAGGKEAYAVYPVFADATPESQTGGNAEFELRWGGGTGKYYYEMSFGDGFSYDPANNNTVTYTADQVNHTYNSGNYTATLAVRSGTDSANDYVYVDN